MNTVRRKLSDIPNIYFTFFFNLSRYFKQVADLKKKLKEFGLPITGNKTELIERLQVACMSSKELDSFESSHLSLDESQTNEINELENADNASLEDSALLLLYNSSQEVNSSLEDSKILDGAENKLNIISNSTPVSMPPKKRTLSKTDSTGMGVEKKMLLNRTNVAHTDFNIINPATESKPATAPTDNKEVTEEKRVLTVKTMSAAERLAMRAKRFNTSNTAAVTSVSAKNNRNSKQSILSSSVAPDLDVLKKRAERFGQSVSTVMKQIEQKEKLLKRKCKFGASLAAVSATSSLDELDKKRQRAERFGIS